MRTTANLVANFRNIVSHVFGLVLLLAAAQAQTFTVLHYFTGGADGATPIGGMYQSSAGKLYGTTSQLGEHDYGNVFEISPLGSGWTLVPIYSF